MRLYNQFTALILAGILLDAPAWAEETTTTERKKFMPAPLIHITDLYHPPCDPDDHWDLASLYGLVKMERIELLGVVIDYPLPPDSNGIVPLGAGEPAVQALAQMNYITGKSVPAAIGSGIPFEKAVASGKGVSHNGYYGPDFILNLLRQSAEPVVITVAGSCRDVALAGRKDPDLFRAKCKGIYLNAGTANPPSVQLHYREWNVDRDPAAYRELFALPCPVYWMPCFEDLARFEVTRHGSFWNFRQGDVLAHVSAPVQNYLLHALTHSTDQRWMSVILGGVDQVALEAQCNSYRNMWCTAGFLHLAGLTVSLSGELRELDNTEASEALFHFKPIRMHLDPEGREQWEASDGPTDRFIFEVNDPQAYTKHMPEILGTLMKRL